MNMNQVKKKIVCFLVAACLFLLAGDVFALHFRIDKGKVRMKLPPGWSDGGVIKVENMSGEPINVRAYVGDWVYSDQDGSKDFLPASNYSKSCAEWIKFYPADFTISPHGIQDVNYVVAVPQGAAGGYYAVLFFEAQGGTAVDSSTGASVKVYNRIASLFYIEPDGTVEVKAQVSGVNVINSRDGFQIKADFENTGNVDITSKGIFDIIDEEGIVFARGEFNEVYTLPQDKAKISAQSSGAGLMAGKYDLILTFDLGADILVKEYSIEVSSSGAIVGIKELE
ncbi:MAG: hypothetical protein PHY46_01670 [Candidatus Omnitrophica bacterium]|nr:hypothetical protein [Candidatus Omnitrophota bacterium]MDD5356146.1 hypothetical protein [Candidatus Omnitrophota bacterium]